MVSKNSSLSAAKNAKEDEFYTQLNDIENELKHYKDFFKDKVVFCNCDDPYESNFFKYFALNFNRLQLKKLISISYSGSPIVGKEYNLFEENGQEFKVTKRRAYKVVMTELKDVTGDGKEDLEDVKELIKHRIRYLKDDGDFRKAESMALLKQADVVVTNPPFSLFREYLAQLVASGKKFVIIGSQNAITYKEVFPLLKENKVWLGYGFNAGNAFFKIPSINGSKYAEGVYDKKTGLVKFRNCCWYTNIDIAKRHEDLILYKNYSPEEYPKYDNYDVIEVSKIADIPCDYNGVMGVPITFLDKYNPEQFNLIGMAEDNGRGFSGKESKWDGTNPHCVVNGKNKFKRVFIRRK